MKLLTQNKLLKQTSQLTGERVLNFGIPALELPSGKRTCPFAGDCEAYCYATKGTYKWSNVEPAYVARYEATLRPDFPMMMLRALQIHRPTYLRIHDAGDWYSREYRDKWLAVIREAPHIRFYTYTKSVPLFKELDTLPHNLSVTYSLGGTMDHLVNLEQDRHARIFDTMDEMQAAGYVSANTNDLYAAKWHNPFHRVGLLWNGPRKQQDATLKLAR